jgi:Bacterial extracellular solute-binding proteins, family 5 Middle
MKLRLFLYPAAISVALICAGRVETSQRPRYGGTLRVEIGAVVHSLDPAGGAADADEAAAKSEIGALLYDQRNPDGSYAGVAGSGPFHIAEWESGKHVTLAANENYRGGRPFVDSIDIEMGRAAKDRVLDLEVGKADFAEIPTEEARRVAERGVRVSASEPNQLMAIVFIAGRGIAEDARAREALARSIDRAAIVNFILQKEGEPAGGLLPQWANGTAFLFPAATDAAVAKELWSQISGSPKIALGYDSGDSLDQAIAERIAVNVKDAGIDLTPEAIAIRAPSPANYDARLVRLRITSSHPRDALAGLQAVLAPMAGLDLAALPAAASSEQIYDHERAIVKGDRVVPLVWLPEVYGLSRRVRDWKAPAPGEGWPFADVWLEQESQ